MVVAEKKACTALKACESLDPTERLAWRMQRGGGHARGSFFFPCTATRERESLGCGLAVDRLWWPCQDHDTSDGLPPIAGASQLPRPGSAEKEIGTKRLKKKKKSRTREENDERDKGRTKDRIRVSVAIFHAAD